MPAQPRESLHKFTGFQKGTAITERALTPDVYAAYLFDVREVDTKHGQALKLFYYVLAPDVRPRQLVELNEIAGESYSNDSKFMRRVANVNGVDVFPTGTELSADTKYTGALRLVTSRSEDGYTRIDSSMILADGSLKRQLMATLQREMPNEFPAQGAFDFARVSASGTKATDDDTVPF